jgi:hypothetical protein
MTTKKYNLTEKKRTNGNGGHRVARSWRTGGGARQRHIAVGAVGGGLAAARAARETGIGAGNNDGWRGGRQRVRSKRTVFCLIKSFKLSLIYYY